MAYFDSPQAVNNASLQSGVEQRVRELNCLRLLTVHVNRYAMRERDLEAEHLAAAVLAKNVPAVFGVRAYVASCQCMEAVQIVLEGSDVRDVKHGRDDVWLVRFAADDADFPA